MIMISWIWTLYTAVPFLTFPFFLVGFCSLISYFGICYYQSRLKDQDLKRKYGAQWALVTGGSSGIGLAITKKLASQGVSVIVAALEDQTLTDAIVKLKEEFPNVQFKSVGVNLGSSNPQDYMGSLEEATKDVDVTLIFNNAGYIFVSLFHKCDVVKHVSNYNCNATAAVYITHHFAQKMSAKRLRGLIAFTSSPGGFFPSPMTVMYASTKAFLTTFGASIAGELADDKIDVVVVHPSPVASNFYNNTALLSIVKFFQKQAVPPSVIADSIFSAAGRLVIVDQGPITMIFKCVLKILDWNVLAQLMSRNTKNQKDFKNVKAAATSGSKKDE